MMEMLIRWENLAMEVMLIESVFQMRNKAVIGTDAICVNQRDAANRWTRVPVVASSRTG